MKSQLKLNKIGSCMCFIVVVAIALSLSGCQELPPPPTQPTQSPQQIIVEKPVTLMALNDDIIASVGGLAAMQGTAFFVSDVLNLRLDSINQDFTAVGERIVRTSDIYDSSVRIEPTQKGKLHGPQEGNILYVDFETNGRNLVVPFARQGSGTSVRYEIRFTGNPADHKIDVGAASYVVGYGGNRRDETPYLLFILEDDIRLRR